MAPTQVKYTGQYKTACDKCGKRVTKRRQIWSYRDAKGRMRGRCKKHLK